MTTNPIGIYLHIPFCHQKCNYCDFSSFAGVKQEVRECYVAKLIEEIKSYKCDNKIKADSIFFGGGTPSLLTVEEFSKITEALYDSFDVCDKAEFSIEANPKTLTYEKLSHYLSCGVNRVSLGMQSIHENELKFLGRIHSYADSLEAIRLFDRLGVDNFNLDLMYGIPEQTLSSFRDTLRVAIDSGAAHISSYGLIVEEGTDFYRRRNQLPLPDEDEECDMYALAAQMLGGAGFSHYEISNYAKSGNQCQHNLKYWRGYEYIGVGLAAHSYFGNIRYSNTSRFSEYLSSDFTKYRMEEPIDNEERAYEYVMLRLRLSEGFSLSEYQSFFGKSFLLGRENKLESFRIAGLISLTDDSIALTERGFYLSNTLLSELI